MEALGDSQQERLVEILRRAGGNPVSFADLRGAGVSFPAAVIGELELNGYAFERVYEQGRLLGVRLRKPIDVEPSPLPARRGWRWRRPRPST